MHITSFLELANEVDEEGNIAGLVDDNVEEDDNEEDDDDDDDDSEEEDDGDGGDDDEEVKRKLLLPLFHYLQNCLKLFKTQLVHLIKCLVLVALKFYSF